MSHFAEIVNGVVVNVIVAEQDFIDTLTGKWVQTSYNTRGGIHFGPDGKPDGGIALRRNYASIGMKYDEELDEFVIPPLYPSWVIDSETGNWTAPISRPPLWVNGVRKYYEWNEDTLSWIEKQISEKRPNSAEGMTTLPWIQSDPQLGVSFPFNFVSMSNTATLLSEITQVTTL